MKNKCVIGTWGWGSGINGGGMIFGAAPKESTLEITFSTAVNNSLLIFDTAPVYGGGSSEKLLGKLAGNNSDIIISTKYFPIERFGKTNVKKSLTKSLLRLNREYADILWLHQAVNIENNMEAMAELILEGKAKHIGISNADLSDVRLAQDTLSKYDIKLYGVQNHYSLIFRGHEESGLLDYCLKNDIEFWAYMLLEQGALTGIKQLPALSRRGIAFGKSKIEKLTELTDKMSELALEHETDNAGIAIAHACSKGMIPIVGATSPEHVEKLASSSKLTLSPNEISLLEELADKSGVSVKGVWEQ